MIFQNSCISVIRTDVQVHISNHLYFCKAKTIRVTINLKKKKATFLPFPKQLTEQI